MQNRPLTLIFITLLIDVIGIGIIIPILPPLIKQIGGMGLSEAARWGGFLVFTYAAAQFLFAPIMGALSDKWGRRPVLIVALLGLGLDYIFHALAPTLGLLFLGRLIAGMCGASFTTASAYIADISAPEKRAQNFGLIGVAFGVGFILGPVIGGFAGILGPRFPFWIAAALSLINAGLCFFMLPESLPVSERRHFDWKRANPFGAFKQIRKFPVVIGLFLPLFLLYLASHAVQSNWPFYTMYKFKWDEKMVGISLGIVGLMVAIVQGGLIRFIVPKLGEKRSIIVGFGLYFLGMLLFALATNTVMMMSFIVVYTLGGICGPALQGIMAGQVPSNQQGELNGGMTSLIAITSVFGPLMMNGLFSYFTGDKAPIILPGAPMLLGAALILLATLACIRPLRKIHGMVEDGPTE
jgi:MFS transporter, DHA1 family, tetracycline resistance protein